MTAKEKLVELAGRARDAFNAARKFWITFGGGLVGWAGLVIASDSGPVTAEEWIALAGVFVIGGATYGVPNVPKANGPAVENDPG